MNYGPRMDAVIFDLGGVLIDWNPRYLFRRLFRDEGTMEWFLSEVCSAEWNHAHDAGQRFAVGIAEASSRHPEYSAYIQCYLDRWPEMLGGLIEETARVVEDLHLRKVPIFALTNWSAETFDYARRRFDVLRLFDDILVSGVEAVAKPDPAIFSLAARRFQVEPTRTVFFDDNGPNVAAAAKVGFVAVHFSGTDVLAPSLEPIYTGTRFARG